MMLTLQSHGEDKHELLGNSRKDTKLRVVREGIQISQVV